MSKFWQGDGEMSVKFFKSLFLMSTKTMNSLELVSD